ncbi:quinolinate synthase NadA [Candidatus Avelusimicrobium caledoniensis]|uniref:quinolinate synthase NadA n=1 Tax=Candidatus Avelusimicrobium caledoniensis TaxID=3416220 RepID=UPI003D0FC558
MLRTLEKEAVVMQEAQRLYGLLHNVSKTKTDKWTLEDCLAAAPYTLSINKFKKEQNAVILAHSYTTPDLVYGVADFRGDSYELALKARESSADVIVFAGVWFMAETAKIINPSKKVLIPAGKAGCSLADAMTGDEVRALRAKHPGVPALCYINSSADVKAACDACVTSGNVYDIAQKMPGEELIFVPDMLMAENLAAELQRRGTPKKIIADGGSCCVHDKYRPSDVKNLRAQHPDIRVLAHPECSIEVCRECDYVGSTKGMVSYVASSPDKIFGLLTEHGLVNRLEAEHPDKQFIWPFGTCAYMKKNSLINTLEALVDPRPEQIVCVDEQIAAQAKKSIEKMFELAK